MAKKVINSNGHKIVIKENKVKIDGIIVPLEFLHGNVMSGSVVAYGDRVLIGSNEIIFGNEIVTVNGTELKKGVFGKLKRVIPSENESQVDYDRMDEGIINDVTEAMSTVKNNGGRGRIVKKNMTISNVGNRGVVMAGLQGKGQIVVNNVVKNSDGSDNKTSNETRTDIVVRNVNGETKVFVNGELVTDKEELEKLGVHLDPNGFITVGSSSSIVVRNKRK